MAALARAHSDDMTSRNYEGHYSPEGFGPIDRLHRAGLSCRKQTHAGISENITVVLANQIIEPSSESLAVDAVKSWKGSPGHRQNFMARKFGSTGVGASYGTWEGRKAVYLTQVFC